MSTILWPSAFSSGLVRAMKDGSGPSPQPTLTESNELTVFADDGDKTGKVGTPTIMMNDMKIYCSVATHGH